MGEVWVCLGIDLLRRKNENRSNFLLPHCLQDQGSIVEKTKVPVKNKQIHYDFWTFPDRFMHFTDQNNKKYVDSLLICLSI